MQKDENLSSILKPIVKKADYAGVSLIPGQADGDKHITRACWIGRSRGNERPFLQK